MKRGVWHTRFGFYLIAIGSALSLGNLWRFPYVVGENGGGAFVLLYVLATLVIGLPLLIGELILGKNSGQSVLRAVNRLSKTSPQGSFHNIIFPWAARFSVLLSFVVLSYYSVISGWVLYFISQYFVGFFSATDSAFPTLKVLMSHGYLQWALASVHLLITLIVVGKGVQEGLEKWIVSLMPFFAVLMIFLVSQTMSLNSSPEVLRFLFYPDFSKLTYSSLIHAVGHAFFTLSVGFGTMVTFGSYMREEDHVPTAGFRVTLVDTFVSFFAALLVFPIVFQSANIQAQNPALLFEALPNFLIQSRWGSVFGFLFFVSLYFAALNASFGLLETIVSNLMDLSKLRMKRTYAAWLTGGAAFLLAFFPAFSETQFEKLQFGGQGLLELLDSILINWLLPVGGLGLCYVVGKGLTEKEKNYHFRKEAGYSSYIMYSHWGFVLRWVAPIVIIVGLFLQIISIIIS